MGVVPVDMLGQRPGSGAQRVLAAWQEGAIENWICVRICVCMCVGVRTRMQRRTCAHKWPSWRSVAPQSNSDFAFYSSKKNA